LEGILQKKKSVQQSDADSQYRLLGLSKKKKNTAKPVPKSANNAA